MLRGRVCTSSSHPSRNIQDLTPSPRERGRFARSPRTRSVRVLAGVSRIRSVRTAWRLSRPSMGRDTLTLPNHERSPRQGELGPVSQAPRHVCGRRRRAGPVPESGPATARGRHIASRPADTGRSGRGQMLEAPERQAPVLPAAEIREARKPARSAGKNSAQREQRISAASRQKKTRPRLKSGRSHRRSQPSPAPRERQSARRHAHACFLSKNCSSSVEPFRAPVEASRSIVVVTASK